MIYTIELNYNARITIPVEADDEGSALDKARNIAEEADMSDFILTEEKESRVVGQM
jgi:hypothetical protein